ncbi:unnamed protein product [Linum trigynum]|uniref:Uncharacterized protein n=1 Tax=Linum trigynum TaxID=586398 RepID=A0AAV2F8H2_9ROSI
MPAAATRAHQRGQAHSRRGEHSNTEADVQPVPFSRQGLRLGEAIVEEDRAGEMDMDGQDMEPVLEMNTRMEPRHRRLLLDDSDDEIITPMVPTPGEKVEIAEKKKGRRLVKVGASLAVDTSAPPIAPSPSAKAKRTSQNPMKTTATRTKASQKIKGKAGQDTVGGSEVKGGTRPSKPRGKASSVSKAVQENTSQEGQRALKAKGKASLEKIVADRVESETSQSEGEGQQFEIKKRPTLEAPVQQVQTGQVRQVVAAFEANMALNEDKEPLVTGDGEMIMKLNEYGSNLEDGTRKRALEEV